MNEWCPQEEEEEEIHLSGGAFGEKPIQKKKKKGREMRSCLVKDIGCLWEASSLIN